MVVGMRLSAAFVAGPGLINARTVSKPVRVYTSSTEMSVCTLNFSICIVSFPDPTNPSADCFQYRTRGGGSGDFCHVFVFEWNV